MEINKKLYLAALAITTLILFLILISFPASAVSSTITETQITTGESAKKLRLPPVGQHSSLQFLKSTVTE